MAWQHFQARKNAGLRMPPATLATVATVSAPTGRSVANVATVAGVHPETGVLAEPETVATVATVAGAHAETGFSSEATAWPDDAWTDEDWQAAYDERAGILEYVEGLPRAEAERLARVQVFGDRPVGNVNLTIAREIS